MVIAKRGLDQVGSGSTTVAGLLPNQDKMLRPVCKSYYSLLCCVNNGCSIEFLLEITSVFTVDDFESRSCYFYAESLSVSSITTYLLTTLRVLPFTWFKEV